MAVTVVEGTDSGERNNMVGSRTILTLLVLVAATVKLSGQTDITGSVKNDEGPLSGATVVLIAQEDSTLISFGLTHDDGKFIIERVEAGHYLLQITFLGYGQFERALEIGSDPVDIGEVLMISSSQLLDEVEINAEHVPMLVKKDTLEYNAAAFQSQPNEMVEDLLRKLPGVEVESDGSIKAQGEEVRQVLVDGKRFFGDDPKIATRNLPADAVEKVQIYDKKSDAAEFSGVDDGEEQKTINLDLKEDRKAGVFGNATGGYGTDDRYKSTASLNRFGGRTRISLLGNFNNVNEQGFSPDDYFSFMRGMGRGSRNALDINRGISDGFVTTSAGGLNLNWAASEKADIWISYFINGLDNESQSDVRRENYAADRDNFFTNSMTSAQSEYTNHRINIEYDQEIDSTQDLRIRGSLLLGQASANTVSETESINSEDQPVNRNSSDLVSASDSHQLSLNGTYRKKFGAQSKRILTISGAYNDGLNEAMADLDNTNTIFDLSGMDEITERLSQQQLDADNANDYSLDIRYLEPLSKGLYLELKYRRANYANQVLSEFYDVVNGMLDYNELLSNAYDRDYRYDRYITAVHLNKENAHLSIEAAVQSARLNGDLLFEDIVIRRQVTRFLPRVSWRYSFGSGQNLRLRYGTSVDEPSLVQLQPNPDNSNPLSIYTGNPDLVPEYNHNLTASYFNYNEFDFSSYNAFLSVRYTRNSIVNVTSFNENLVQQTMPENVDYSLGISGYHEYARPIRPLAIRVSLRNGLGYNRGFVFLNGSSSIVQRFNGSIRFRAENRDKAVYDWTAGGSYAVNLNRYSDGETEDIGYSTKSLYGTMAYNIKKSFTLSCGLNVDFYSAETFAERQTVPILKASISKYIFSNQRGELRISAFDLLNRNLGVNRTENQNYVENTETLSLGRYFLASFSYAFKPTGRN